MRKSYYLSSVIGAGTEQDPFRPLAGKLGKFSSLDLRPEETRLDGWCFAYVEVEDDVHADSEQDDLIYLTNDPHMYLNKSKINVIENSLRVTIKSRTLADIMAEILLFQRIPGRGLRPGADGKYRLYLGDLVWEATEEEAYKFVGSLRKDELPGRCASASPNRPADLKPAISEALGMIAHVLEQRNAGWLDAEIARVRNGQSNHPLVTRYVIASSFLKQSDSTASWFGRSCLDIDACTRYARHLSSYHRGPLVFKAACGGR